MKPQYFRGILILITLVFVGLASADHVFGRICRLRARCRCVTTCPCEQPAGYAVIRYDPDRKTNVLYRFTATYADAANDVCALQRLSIHAHIKPFYSAKEQPTDSMSRPQKARIVSLSPPQSEYRDWREKSSGKTARAEFLRADGSTLYFRSEDGRIVTCQAERLSEPDREFIAKSVMIESQASEILARSY